MAGKRLQIAAGLRPVKYIANRPAYAKAGYKACYIYAGNKAKCRPAFHEVTTRLKTHFSTYTHYRQKCMFLPAVGPVFVREHGVHHAEPTDYFVVLYNCQTFLMSFIANWRVI
jgi:hypothetical protein